MRNSPRGVLRVSKFLILPLPSPAKLTVRDENNLAFFRQAKLSRGPIKQANANFISSFFTARLTAEFACPNCSLPG